MKFKTRSCWFPVECFFWATPPLHQSTCKNSLSPTSLHFLSVTLSVGRPLLPHPFLPLSSPDYPTVYKESPCNGCSHLSQLPFSSPPYHVTSEPISWPPCSITFCHHASWAVAAHKTSLFQILRGFILYFPFFRRVGDKMMEGFLHSVPFLVLLFL